MFKEQDYKTMFEGMRTGGRLAVANMDPEIRSISEKMIDAQVDLYILMSKTMTSFFKTK